MKSLAVILILGILCLDARGAESANSSSKSEIVIGHSHSLLSKNGDTYEVNVYLPRSYQDDSDKTYPVLYLIDGGRDQDFNHIAGLADLASVNPYIFRELIVVGVRTNNRLFELTSINTDPRYNRDEGALGGSDDFRDLLKNKVIPLAEKTLPSNGRRIVMGESLAGLFIAETFLKMPTLFTDYVSISPSMWYDDRHLSKSSLELLKTHSDEQRHIYFAMADEGGTMQKGFKRYSLAAACAEA